MTVFRAPADYSDWPKVAALIHRSFAYMTPLLGQPAHAMDVSPKMLAVAAKQGTAMLVIDDDIPVACLFARPSRDFSDALYLGWLAVKQSHRGRGLAQTLISASEDEARARNFTALTLDTGRELVDLHAYFQSIGFQPDVSGGSVVSFRKPVHHRETDGNPNTAKL